MIKMLYTIIAEFAMSSSQRSKDYASLAKFLFLIKGLLKNIRQFAKKLINFFARNYSGIRKGCQKKEQKS